MTFPATPRELVTKMKLGGNWIDVSADVRGRDAIRWTSGKSDRSGTTSPATANFTLNNGASQVTSTLGQKACYSMRNPLGPYWNLLTRNTEIQQKLTGLVAPVFDTSSSTTPGAGGFLWTHTGAATATGVLVWVLQSGSTSFQSIFVSYGGVTVPSINSVATATGRIYAFHLGNNVPPGPQVVSFDVTAPGPTLLPVVATFTGGNATELNSLASATNTNANPSVTLATAPRCIVFGIVHSGQDTVGGIAAGAGYTDIIENDFGTDTGSVIRRTTGSTTNPTTVSWTATADTWTAVAYTFSAVSYRFWGELSDLPNTWDITATDADAQVQAAGILRRITQGDRPVFSSLREYYEQFPLVDYWPLDDGPTSTTGVNVAPDGRPWRKYGAAVSSFDGDLQPLSTGFQMATNDGATSTADVLKDPGSSVTVDFVYRPNITGLCYVQLEFGFYRWNLVLRHDGVNNDFLSQLIIRDPVTGADIITNIVDSASNFALVDYKLHHIRWVLENNGANTDVSMYLDGNLMMSGTGNSVNLTTIQQLYVTFSPQLEGAIFTIGHVALWTSVTTAPDLAAVVHAVLSWTGEVAADRFARLCVAAGFPSVVLGNNADTMPMGEQGTDYFSNQLAEIEATDLGILYEPRDQLAIGYRTRSSLYNQDPVVTASFTAGELASGFSPLEDDSTLRNDIFAQRRNGGSFQATKVDGPLSVSAPPAGAGRYKDEIQVNVQTDADLPAIAGWLLALGTVDEPRFAQIRFDLALPGVVNNSVLAEALLRIVEGDLLQVTATGTKLGLYDGVSQIVLGRVETLSDYGSGHEIIFNTAPASVYEVMEFDDGVSRFDPGDASTLNVSLTTSATTMAVLAEVQYDGAFMYWTTDPADMPASIMVGGEQMTVTAIAAGAAGVQNFTVVRAVNGVVKAHSAGDLVYLKRPTILAL